jgi:predicted nucleic acid-binding protein
VNVLLDTDIAIEILRSRDQDIFAKWSELVLSGAAVFYSPVVAAEVWAGALSHERDFISRFFRPLLCLVAEYETGQLAGEFLRQYARSHGLEVPDALIAAAAVQQKAALWTRNRKHYPMPRLTFY